MSKNDEIYDLIVDRLINAHYAFGERLFVKELGAETGASRHPIMSALNRLSAEGFVRIVPQVGCEVINPSRDEIADFFMLFQRTEGVLAELAALRRTEDDLLRLNLAQRGLLSLADGRDPSPREYAALNRDFHHAMHLMSHSPLLIRKQRNNFNMSDFFITHSVGFTPIIADGLREHDQIIAAIEMQQPDRARLQAEAHIAAVASSVLANLDE
ncbi:MAG: GntR family transcriptional regulator [Sphingomonadales bacterium]|nr:GntR family transcriptional regulator [Sphingomonadales bacterium]